VVRRGPHPARPGLSPIRELGTTRDWVEVVMTSEGA
jgi:hypothetical protein